MKLTFVVLALLVSLCIAALRPTKESIAAQEKFFKNTSPVTQSLEFKVVNSVPNYQKLGYMYHLEGDKNLEAIQNSAQIEIYGDIARWSNDIHNYKYLIGSADEWPEVFTYHGQLKRGHNSRWQNRKTKMQAVRENILFEQASYKTYMGDEFRNLLPKILKQLDSIEVGSTFEQAGNRYVNQFTIERIK